MAGISVHGLEALTSALDLDSVAGLMLVDGAGLAKRHVPSFPADCAALVMNMNSSEMAAEVKAALSSVYPSSHLVKLLDRDGEVDEIALADLGEKFAPMVYIAPLGVGTSFEAFYEIVAHLRAPDGCPWDKEQTHLSLRKHLLEESYETLAAMDEENPAKMREEFGDLLLQIVLNAQIGDEYSEFTMTEVLQGIYEKIVRRHPHVFGDLKVEGVGEVLSNWEKLKAAERTSGGEHEKGILDGLPAALPALNQAQEFQERAARVGFDWPEIDGVLEKVREEIEEVRNTSDPEQLAEELGDLFFALVNLARWKEVNAEDALREASLKFRRRFKHIEKRAREMQKPMQEMSLEELDGLWNEAKKIEKENRERE
jgi:tetrapyrrole methylase family protein/MazG family protein